MRAVNRYNLFPVFAEISRGFVRIIVRNLCAHVHRAASSTRGGRSVERGRCTWFMR